MNLEETHGHNRLDGKLILITGGAGGIGRAAATEVMHQGGRTIVVDLPGRAAPPGAELIEADLSELKDIRRMATELLSRYERLDGLVNNVGAIFPERRETGDGIEMTFALNHLSYFATTLLLFGALRQSSSPTVINVSSSHYRAGRMNFDDLEFERRYDMNKAYCQSKLANQLFTFELARRVHGSGIAVAAVHPGAVESGFGDPLRGFWRVMWQLSRPLRRSAEAAGKEIADLLGSTTLRENSGGYFFKGSLQETLPRARDPIAAQTLWKRCLDMSGLVDHTSD